MGSIQNADVVRPLLKTYLCLKFYTCKTTVRASGDTKIQCRLVFYYQDYSVFDTVSWTILYFSCLKYSVGRLILSSCWTPSAAVLE
jgi:hypothetical protein